jgi:hypothetical protein
MKTSKIIFISLLSLITIYIVTAMIEVRITGKKQGQYNTSLKVKKIALPAFNTMYLIDNKVFKIFEGDSAFLEIAVPEASEFPGIDYFNNGDTLQIKGFQKSLSDRVFAAIYVPGKLRNIKLVNSEILIITFNSEDVSFDLDHSKVSFALNRSSYPAFGTMKIKAIDNSSFTANSMAIDTLGIDLQNSQANLTVSIKSLTCDLKYNSKILTKQPMEISLKRDASSSFNFFGK